MPATVAPPFNRQRQNAAEERTADRGYHDLAARPRQSALTEQRGLRPAGADLHDWSGD